ncbi:MAG: (d)CMP kinase [endosymbiont of Galathealinum brachiosum]|uniref:Cytidylate kinase n=1 Tax=endosymbiont of Galathealinum brachiosum TaxID=2200906 RepID=A0A370DHA4_9GAMM|nr:MAG: (d)CMP kinase [endosymbiont of Galathealinum brachiosum]
MTSKTIPVITIDGPSGAGKGTIAQNVATALSFHILDSGSLYRLTALASQDDEIDLSDESAIAELALNLPVEFIPTDTGLQILLRDEDVTEAIRKEEIGMRASKIAALPKVRKSLLERQRSFSEEPGLVADGRDMGTTVFSDAPVKIFMTASAEERAERRYKQLKEKGINANIAALVKDLKSRDEQDANRAVSPLKPAEDAILLDTTEMSIEEVTQKVLDLAKQRLA